MTYLFICAHIGLGVVLFFAIRYLTYASIVSKLFYGIKEYERFQIKFLLLVVKFRSVLIKKLAIGGFV